MNIDEILNEQDKFKKYSLIIDYITNYLDNDMRQNNYCDFKDGKCIANRLGKSAHKENGCCYIYKEGLCKELTNHGCKINCLSCKLFMCAYIEKKYKKINLYKIFPLKKVFNRKQIYILKKSFFKDKDEILNLLLSN